MSFEFQHLNQQIVPNRVFCIGKNYSEHIKELSGQAPGHPVVFMKPVQSLVPHGSRVARPTHGQDLQHEVEVVLLLGSGGKNLRKEEALQTLAAVSLGIDLTLRDVQRDLKQKGLPWEAAKAFENSAPLGEWVALSPDLDLQNIPFECRVNGEIRQQGNTRDMLFPVADLIAWLSSIWKLEPGDLVYTGTPAGVGPLPGNATLTTTSPVLGQWEWEIE